MRNTSLIQVIILDDRDFIETYQNFSPVQLPEMAEFIRDHLRRDVTKQVKITKFKPS